MVSTNHLSRHGKTDAEALAEVDRRIAAIDAAMKAQPPGQLKILDDPLEAELEVCRKELNDLLFKAERLAAQLRQRYAELVEYPALPAAQQFG